MTKYLVDVLSDEEKDASALAGYSRILQRNCAGAAQDGAPDLGRVSKDVQLAEEVLPGRRTNTD